MRPLANISLAITQSHLAARVLTACHAARTQGVSKIQTGRNGLRNVIPTSHLLYLPCSALSKSSLLHLRVSLPWKSFTVSFTGPPHCFPPRCLQKAAPRLQPDTCEINITLTCVSNFWCQSQTEQVEKENQRGVSSLRRDSVNISVRVSYFWLELAHLLISASGFNLLRLWCL